MDGVTVINHPLVQHKLTKMRQKETSTAGFRRLLREISTPLCYEMLVVAVPSLLGWHRV